MTLPQVIVIIGIYMLIALLIWIELPARVKYGKAPKFWKIFFWGPAMLSEKVRIWMWKDHITRKNHKKQKEGKETNHEK